MQFSLSTQTFDKIKADTLMVGVFSDNLLTQTAHQIDEVNHGYLTDIIKH